MFSSNTFSSCDAGMELNTSPISVDEAIQKVLLNTKPLPCREVRVSCDLIGRYLAEDIHAPNDHPQFPTSIMDGYAVCAPAAANVPFIVKGSVHAGQEKSGAESEVQFEETAYITTGARLPVGANAVIKIEDVTLLCANDGKSTVIFNHDVHPGENVREIGSDLKKGDLLLAKGQKLRPSELGLLSTAGLDKVLSYSSPVVGVLSTGDELVEPTEHVPPGSTKIRDCNRLVLLSALKEDGLATVDLGIVRDDKELVRARLLHAADICDVVISSGGVSMGAADYIKPLLGELGHILFGKLNMKPGKPTTFAIMREVGVDGKETLFFGLPGNPVSCM